MVKTINMRFNEDLFFQLKDKKEELSMKKKTMLSWEDFFILVTKI